MVDEKNKEQMAMKIKHGRFPHDRRKKQRANDHENKTWPFLS
ncbi:hypothetical protein ACMGE7_09445 [Macrococcus equi]